MIPEVGQFALIAALLLALANGVLPMRRRRPRRRRLDAHGAAEWRRAQFVLVAIAFGCLAASFMDNDFSVLYVGGQFEFDAAADLSLHGGVGRGAKARSCSGLCFLRSGSPRPRS